VEYWNIGKKQNNGKNAIMGYWKIDIR